MADGGGAAPPPPPPAPSRAERLDLGWCAGSAVQPRKQRAIEGVGAASFLTLQAQLYRAQARGVARTLHSVYALVCLLSFQCALPRHRAPQEARAAGEGGVEDDAPRARRLAVRRRDEESGAHVNAFGDGNAGVRERAAADELAAAAGAPEGVTTCVIATLFTRSVRARGADGRCVCFHSALERKAALYEQLRREGGGADAYLPEHEARYSVDFAMKVRRSCCRQSALQTTTCGKSSVGLPLF